MSQECLYDLCPCGHRKRKISKTCRACWKGQPLRTHCNRGHEYTPENTYITTQGHRQCVRCVRIHALWRRYRLTEDDFNSLLSSQAGKCAVPGCGATSPGPRDWHVDHDHACCPTHPTCGKCVRGLICHGCNTALGLAGESVERLAGMIEYLARTSTQLASQ